MLRGADGVGPGMSLRCWLFVVPAALGLMHAAPASAAVSFERSLYNSPVVTDDATGTIIRVENRPAGVFYRASLDPARTYRVRLRGQVSTNGMVLRISRDEHQEWTRTPNGLLAFRASGVSELELLVFGHYETDDAEYRLFELTADTCDDCPNEDDLRAQILSERPAVAAALARGDSLGAATEVMRWAAPRIPVAGGAPLASLLTTARSAVELYYDNFPTNQIGVLCAGASDSLVKLLALFELDAFEMDFGDTALYTHAVVIVRAPRDDATRWYVLDPTFNATFALRGSGAPLPLLEALELWQAGQDERITVVTESLATRQVVPNAVDPPIPCGTDVRADGRAAVSVTRAHKLRRCVRRSRARNGLRGAAFAARAGSAVLGRLLRRRRRVGRRSLTSTQRDFEWGRRGACCGPAQSSGDSAQTGTEHARRERGRRATGRPRCVGGLSWSLAVHR